MMGFMGLGWIFGLLFIGVIVWAVFRISGSGQNRLTRGRNDRGKAIEILKERYARGEIGKDEFERMKRELG